MNFEFREILQEEAEEAAEIEQICFPPHEACDPKRMRERVAAAPEMFLLAYDPEAGRIAGFLNGIATCEESFRDAFFEDASLHMPDGPTVMLMGLDVRPEYRGRGLARELVHRYAQREQVRGRRRLILTCSDEKVAMYQKMGFRELGISASVWGGERWHDMELTL